jgi:hypothetical protein
VTWIGCLGDLPSRRVSDALLRRVNLDRRLPRHRKRRPPRLQLPSECARLVDAPAHR